MFYHLVFDGVADGPLGVALDVVASAAQLVRSGAGAHAGAPTYLDQKVVSVGGAPVRSRTGRPVAVDGDFETMVVDVLRTARGRGSCYRRVRTMRGRSISLVRVGAGLGVV